MKCPHCQNEIKNEDQYCPHCDQPSESKTSSTVLSYNSDLKSKIKIHGIDDEPASTSKQAETKEDERLTPNESTQSQPVGEDSDPRQEQEQPADTDQLPRQPSPASSSFKQPTAIFTQAPVSQKPEEKKQIEEGKKESSEAQIPCQAAPLRNPHAKIKKVDYPLPEKEVKASAKQTPTQKTEEPAASIPPRQVERKEQTSSQPTDQTKETEQASQPIKKEENRPQKASSSSGLSSVAVMLGIIIVIIIILLLIF